MMLTAIHTSTSSLTPPSHPLPPHTHNQTMDKTPSHLLPMATALPPPQFLISPGTGYTLLPTGCDAFGALHPIGQFAGAARPVATIPYYTPMASSQAQVLVGQPPSAVVDPSSPSSAPAAVATSDTGDISDANSPLMESKVRMGQMTPPGPSSSASSSSSPASSSSSSSSSSRRSPNSNPSLNSIPNANAAATPEGAKMEPMNTRVAQVEVGGLSPEEDEGEDEDEPLQNRVEVKREPLNEEGPSHHPTCTRRNSESNLDEASSSRGSYAINALIDVPRSLESRTSSLSSSLSSFRFGGSLSTLWAASQLNMKNLPATNMKSTGNLTADAGAMPSLGNQYYAFGGSLPELSLTSLTRLLPNSSANDPNITSCPSLFTLFHSPLYVYPSQQHLTTPFINANGSITFGSFLSNGNGLCSTQKAGSAEDSSHNASGSSSDITDRENKVMEGAGVYAIRTNGSSPSSGPSRMTEVPSSSSSLSLSSSSSASSRSTQSGVEMKMFTYSPLAGSQGGGGGAGVNVITALPAFGSLSYNIGGSASGPVSTHVTPSYSSAVTSTQVSTANLNTLACVASAQQQQQQQQQQAKANLSGCLPSVADMTQVRTIQEPMSTDSKDGVLTLNTQPAEIFMTPPQVSRHQEGIGLPSPVSVINGLHPPKLEKDSCLSMCTGSPKDDMGMEVSPLLSSVSTTPPPPPNMPYTEHPVKKEKDRPYKCDHPGCGRSFSFPAHLRSHIQQIHISYRPCKCEFPGCGKRFYTPQHLNVHRRVHTGERPFICPYTDCAKAFTTAGNLKNHIRTHTGERPYACKFEGCTKRFAEMSSLKKHELTHTGEKPYKCRVCGKAFSQAGSRNTHERKHSRTEEEESGDGKPTKRYRIKRMSPMATNS